MSAKRKLGEFNMLSRRRRRRRRPNLKKRTAACIETTEKTNQSMELSSVKEFEETDQLQVISIFDDEDGGDDDDDDVELQQILLYSAQFYSGNKKSESRSGKEVTDSSSDYSIGNIPAIYEDGGSSCKLCEICDEASPPGVLRHGNFCKHTYCEGCIRSYIAEKINEDIHIHRVNCPASDCKKKLDIKRFMPREFMIRVKEAIRETEVLATMDKIECPFEDCFGELIDDKKGFLIKACPDCCRLFCFDCRVPWHFGMSCKGYQGSLRDLNMLLKIFSRKDDDEDKKYSSFIPIYKNKYKQI